MPIYDYQCAACGKVTQVMQKISDPAPEKCEHCNKKGPLTKLLSPTAFILKGGGWYSDAYSSKSGAKESKSDTKTDTPSTTSASGSTKKETATSSDTSTPAPKAKDPC